MSPYIPQWESRKNWVEYEDGSFEPVNPQEDINKKKRGNHGKVRPDWWVVTQTPDWRPEQYADTKRGREAERELGFAEKPKQERPPAQKKQPATRAVDSIAPQHENTGKAMVRLGGKDDGKITLLDDELAPIGQKKPAKTRQPNSTQDVVRKKQSLLSSQRREKNARTDVDHRTGHEKRKEREKELGPGRRAVSAAREQIGSEVWRKNVAKDNFGEGQAKCNLFVYDMQQAAGNPVPRIGGLLGGDPASVDDWRDRTEIEGWKRVDTPREGDIAVYDTHVGIVSKPSATTISAASPDRGDSVVENDWGFRPYQQGKTAFWRYVGKK